MNDATKGSGNTEVRNPNIYPKYYPSWDIA